MRNIRVTMDLIFQIYLYGFAQVPPSVVTYVTPQQRIPRIVMILVT